MNFISRIIGMPLGLIMYGIFALVKNYAIAIAIFTVVIRAVLIPISVKQQKSTAATAAIQPKLDKIKKQYANNPNKVQEEQMKLYAEEGINPMESCAPMLLQLLFLYGVFDVVYRPLTHILRLSADQVEALKTIVAGTDIGANSYFKSRPEIFIMKAVKEGVGDFSSVSSDIIDKIIGFDNTLFGFIDLGSVPNTIFGTPIADWTPMFWGLLFIPITSGIIQLAMTVYNNIKNKKLNPAAAAQMGSMNIMLYGMVAFSVYIGFKFPAGIGFYWICSSLVSIIQTVILHKIYTPEYVEKLIEKDKEKRKNKKRSGFMEKYNEMLQEQMKQNAAAQEKKGVASSRLKVDDETGESVKLSKSQMKNYEKQIIAEARRRQAEKYGDVYNEDDED